MERTFVINIGRQLGSGGKAVGEELARRFGVHMYDKQLLNLAAEQSGLSPDLFEQVDEHRSQGMLATLIGYMKAPFSGDDETMNNVLGSDALFKIQSDVIREIAERESCLFVGRCADYILRDHPRAVNLFLTGNRGDRIARLCSQQPLTAQQAENLIDRTDAKRAAYYNYYSRGVWGEAATYDLCLNTSALGIDGTADFVQEFILRKMEIKRCK